MLLELPGSVRSQVNNVVCPIKRFDFGCIMNNRCDHGAGNHGGPLNLVLWLYDIMHYTTSSFGAAEPFAPDQGFEIGPDVV